MTFAVETLKAAHEHSADHEAELAASEVCGCFFCRTTFPRSEVEAWANPASPTALCPRCGIDAVIGDASGYPVQDQAFLDAMHWYWFEREPTRAELRELRKVEPRPLLRRLLDWARGS